MNESTLSTWLAQNYDLRPSPRVTLLRSYTNDVYLVESDAAKFVLKIYGRGWRSRAEVTYEIGLLDHLDRRGLAVAKAIAGTGNEPLKRITVSTGTSLAVLYEYADGGKPQPPFSAELYFLFGQAIGKMHSLSSDFVGGSPKKDRDLVYLIDEPLEAVRPLLKDRPADLAFLQGLAEKVKNQITALNMLGLDWGPIHGDATLDNLHVNERGEILLFDFDSGGPGWRASDLQGWAIGRPEYREKYRSFIEGYRSVRTLNERDIEASPYLAIAWEIWGLKVDLERRVIIQGKSAVEKYLAEQMLRLAASEKRLR